MYNVSFVLPYAEETVRGYLKTFVVERLKALYPEAEIIIGDYELKPFSRGKAINNGVSKATREIVFIMDTDFIFDKDIVEKAVDLIENRQAPWIIPFNYVHHVNDELTSEILELPVDFHLAGRDMQVNRHLHQGLGSMCCMLKDDFERIGGFDENVIGWGYEDNVFAHIANTLIGNYVRLDVPILHLWHPYLSYYKNDEIKEKNKQYFLKVAQINNKRDMVDFLNRRYKDE